MFYSQNTRTQRRTVFLSETNKYSHSGGRNNSRRNSHTLQINRTYGHQRKLVGNHERHRNWSKFSKGKCSFQCWSTIGISTNENNIQSTKQLLPSEHVNSQWSSKIEHLQFRLTYLQMTKATMTSSLVIPSAIREVQT